ncbi:MAG: nitroreductase family protein [Bacteroidaceae bacterium]|nr:nitroreductase family protein [Bacteroidaceae bacterium]
MDKFSNLAAERRSMRKFTDEKLTADEIRLLERAALIAPTSKHTNGWEFVAVDNPELLKSLSESKEAGAAFVADAPWALVVFGNPTLTDAWIEDCAISAIMVQLQATDLGLGSCWAHIRNRFAADGSSAADNVRRILGVKVPLEPLCIIAVGHKGMDRKPFDESRIQWDKIHDNKY